MYYALSHDAGHCFNYRKISYSFHHRFLPPATEVCEGYVFTGVCLTMGDVCLWSWGCGMGDVCLWSWGCGRHLQADILQGKHTPSGQTPPRQTPPPAQCILGQTPPCGYSGIWSTSGWCASHWNAFLLNVPIGELNLTPEGIDYFYCVSFLNQML